MSNFLTATTTKLPTLKALKELGGISEKTLNELFNPESAYAPLFNALKYLPDGGYEYGYSELLYGLCHAISTSRLGGVEYFVVKKMTNKQVFKDIIIPCAKGLKKANKNFTMGDAWDWMRDNYFYPKR